MHVEGGVGVVRPYGDDDIASSQFLLSSRAAAPISHLRFFSAGNHSRLVSARTTGEPLSPFASSPFSSSPLSSAAVSLYLSLLSRKPAGKAKQRTTAANESQLRLQQMMLRPANRRGLRRTASSSRRPRTTKISSADEDSSSRQ
uniref:Uncharacterized protein n=1 Tax=Solanum tuberosum TaxID=4113 RepID=M1D926_SOLTU